MLECATDCAFNELSNASVPGVPYVAGSDLLAVANGVVSGTKLG